MNALEIALWKVGVSKMALLDLREQRNALEERCAAHKVDARRLASSLERWIYTSGTNLVWTELDMQSAMQNGREALAAHQTTIEEAEK